jgi:cyclic pyranopterin phosphate synthase
MDAAGLSHFDETGASRMVDVSAKPATDRVAIATGRVRLRPETLARILDRSLAKGDVVEVARLAGIMGAKRTPDLIPLCHPVALSGVTVRIEPSGEAELLVTVECRCTGATGVEMEALTAASVACLTIYDMVKGIDRGVEIGPIRLEEKRGGKSGLWTRD